MLIPANSLAHALKTLVHLLPKRSAQPVLEHVLLEPVEGGVAITATDLTTSARVLVSATTPFLTCLPARPLLEFAASVDRRAEVTLVQHGDLVRVTTPGAVLELPQLPASSFPACLQHVGKAIVVEDPDRFLQALSWVSRAIGHDDTRPQLTGLFIDGDDLVATDGHRLHKTTIDGLECRPALVPASAVAFVLRTLKDDDLEISVGENTVRFRSASWTITTRLIDATFPPFQQVIPKAASVGFTMKVGTRDLEAGLKRVCGRGGGHCERLMKLRANGAIVLESNIDDVQRTAAVGAIDSSHEGTEDHLQGFNARYLIDAITDIDAIASLRFSKADNPLLIEVGDRTAVVMPCRL